MHQQHTSAAPEGALTKEQGLKLKKKSPETMIYMAVPENVRYWYFNLDCWGILKATAKSMAFIRKPPVYYFTNYFLALGYSLRCRSKNHECS